MSPTHGFNLALHIAVGRMAVTVGVVLLARRKGTAVRRFWDRMFVGCTVLVCLPAGPGLLVFRLMPELALLAGWGACPVFGGRRAVRCKAAMLSSPDVLATVSAATMALALLPTVPKPVPANAQGGVGRTGEPARL